MTILVPFDGSDLAEAALVRATELANVLDEDVLAVTIIPAGNAEYARERDWINPDEEFDMDRIVANLHRQVTALCPSSDFMHESVSHYASTGEISNQLQRIAHKEDVSLVVVGSENAGHIATAFSSVGAGVASDPSYDVLIVREKVPSKSAKLRETSPHQDSKSEFFYPE